MNEKDSMLGLIPEQQEISYVNADLLLLALCAVVVAICYYL